MAPVHEHLWLDKMCFCLSVLHKDDIFALDGDLVCPDQYVHVGALILLYQLVFDFLKGGGAILLMDATIRNVDVSKTCRLALSHILHLYIGAQHWWAVCSILFLYYKMYKAPFGWTS